MNVIFALLQSNRCSIERTQYPHDASEWTNIWSKGNEIKCYSNPNRNLNYLNFQALSQISKENGVVVCPKTNELFVQPKIEKVYVM